MKVLGSSQHPVFRCHLRLAGSLTRHVQARTDA